jgi:hypothetical protein
MARFSLARFSRTVGQPLRCELAGEGRKVQVGHHMKLVNARLCLDCEEVHEQQHCPICGSESFAFMTRWVTPSDTIGGEAARAARPPDAVPRSDNVERREQLARREQVDAYRQILNPGTPPRRGRLVARGAIGLALLGIARAVWRAAPDAKTPPVGERTAQPRKEIR